MCFVLVFDLVLSIVLAIQPNIIWFHDQFSSFEFQQTAGNIRAHNNDNEQFWFLACNVYLFYFGEKNYHTQYLAQLNLQLTIYHAF